MPMGNKSHSLGWLVNKSIFTPAGLITMKFVKDTYSPKWMIPNDFGDIQNFSLAPPVVWLYGWSCQSVGLPLCSRLKHLTTIG